jgi:hypothetical protein
VPELAAAARQRLDASAARFLGIDNAAFVAVIAAAAEAALQHPA